MQNRNHRIGRTVVLFVIWAISWLIINMVMGGINVYRLVYHIQPACFLGLDVMFYFVFPAVIGYFLPLMFVIHKRSGCERVKWLRIVSTIIIIYLIFFSVLAICTLLDAFFSTT